MWCWQALLATWSALGQHIWRSNNALLGELHRRQSQAPVHFSAQDIMVR